MVEVDEKCYEGTYYGWPKNMNFMCSHRNEIPNYHYTGCSIMNGKTYLFIAWAGPDFMG